MILLFMVGSFGVAFLLAWGLNWLALVPWRRAAGKHWTERARLLWPARKSASFNLWFVAANLVLVNLVLAPEVNLLFSAGPGFFGGLAGSYFMNHEVYPDARFKSWLHLVAAGLFLFFAFWVLLAAAAFAMPENFGLRTWLLAGGFLLLLLAFQFGLRVRLLRWLRLLQPAPERLNGLVRETSQKMGVPVRASWVLPTYFSNALALPLTRQLIFTEKLLAIHPDDEIKAICAHELGHLNEPRTVLLVRTLFSLSAFPLIFVKPLESLGYDVLIVLGVLSIAVLLLWLVGVRVSRRMEKRADRIAVENQNTEPAVYVRALERLYQTSQIPAVMPRRSNKIHPDLYDRMTAAGVTPDFPKPAPPSRLSWTSYVVLAGLFVVPTMAVFVKALWTVLGQALIGHSKQTVPFVLPERKV
jgi:Zn-dependent protease with chaperone function